MCSSDLVNNESSPTFVKMLPNSYGLSTAQVFYFDVKNSADAQFNNIQYLYIGKNESMREGFIGCISRVEFEDIYPLKYYYQDPRPPHIHSEPRKAC